MRRKKSALFFTFLCLVLTATWCRAEVLIDQLDDTERIGGFVATQSHFSGSETLSSFMLPACALVQKITWLGSIQPNADNLYPFVIRIYPSRGSRRPAYRCLYEVNVSAQMQIPDGDNTFPYVFSCDVPDELYLQAGQRYWISIVYTGLSEDAFYMALEKGTTGGRSGHGGAVRWHHGSIWLPTNFVFPFPYLLCRGFSIQVEGEYLAEDDCPVVAE